MKKIYMSPTIKVVKIKRRPQLLNASVEGFRRGLVDSDDDFDGEDGL